jgi:hypothetical protein
MSRSTGNPKAISPYTDERFPLGVVALEASQAREVTAWRRGRVRSRRTGSHVYWLVAEGAVRYVGVSGDVGRRIYELRYTSQVGWDRAWVLPVRHRSRETWCIRAWRPPENQHQHRGVIPAQGVGWLQKNGFL